MLHKLPKFLTSVLSCQPQVHVWHTCLLWLTHHFISCSLYRFIFLRTLSSSLFLSVYPCLFSCVSRLLISVILSLSLLQYHHYYLYLSTMYVSIYMYLSYYLQCIYLPICNVSIYLSIYSVSPSQTHFQLCSLSSVNLLSGPKPHFVLSPKSSGNLNSSNSPLFPLFHIIWMWLALKPATAINLSPNLGKGENMIHSSSQMYM